MNFISSIHTCISLTDRVVYEYNNCENNFNEIYSNNSKFIAFVIRGEVINTEKNN